MADDVKLLPVFAQLWARNAPSMADGVFSLPAPDEPWSASVTARHSTELQGCDVNCKAPGVTSFAHRYIKRGEGTRLRREVKKFKCNITSKL
jgi:hypothetical protein